MQCDSARTRWHAHKASKEWERETSKTRTPIVCGLRQGSRMGLEGGGGPSTATEAALKRTVLRLRW
jgi:hypothetical protein